MLKMRITLLFLLLLCNVGVNAATLFVDSLDDTLGTTATLRQTIIDASDGNTIQFSVSGTIFLDEALGELVVDKKLIIDGQNRIVVDGQNQINVCFHLTGASASDSIIQNITIQNFSGHDVDPGSGTASQELFAVGVFISNDAENCSVIATVIRNIHSGINQEAAGILSREDTGDLLGNTIETISSEDNPAGNTGFVGGIALTSGDIVGNCSNNTIYNLFSGTATSNSGTVIGILAEDGGGEIQGDCTHNTIYNLASGTANNDSGSVVGIFASEIQENCSNNSLYNLASGTADNNSFRVYGGFVLGVVGIFIANAITGDCCNNTMSYIVSGQANNISGRVGGIHITNTLAGECCDNAIRHLTSGDSSNMVGRVNGILSFAGVFEKNCLNNTVQYLTSGIGRGEDPIIGIFVSTINGNCLNNQITDISSIGTTNKIQTGGIRFNMVDDGNTVACNIIDHITGEQDNESFGIKINNANNIIIKHNSISNIVDLTDPAFGLSLGISLQNLFTNSLVFSNAISNIIGSANNGFGISIFGAGTGESSTGNDLLNNSIFDINGKAINIIDNGVPVDATVTLQSAVCGANKIIIRGTVEPELGFEESEFVVQFFASNSSIPPQTMTFIGETTIQADDATPFMVEIKTCLTDTTGYLTATATALPLGTAANNNTSEVSNTIPGCDSSTICSLFCTPVPTPPACPA